MPAASATTAVTGGESTVTGEGGGSRPGHGAGLRPAPGSWRASRLPQGTSVARSAGPRPPWRRPTTTASVPSRCCTRTKERAARVSAAEAPPKKSGWRGGAPSSSSSSSPRARRRRWARAGSRSPASSPSSPRATRWHAAPSAPKRARTWAAGSAANCARVWIPRRCKVTARSVRRRTETDHGPRNSAVAPLGTTSLCAGRQQAGEQAVGRPDERPVGRAEQLGQCRRQPLDHHRVAAEEPARTTGGNGADAQSDRIHPRAEPLDGPKDPEELVHLLTAAALGEQGRAPHHDEPLHPAASPWTGTGGRTDGGGTGADGDGGGRHGSRRVGPRSVGRGGSRSVGRGGSRPSAGGAAAPATPATDPSPEGSHRVWREGREPARRPVTWTSARRPRRWPWAAPTPCHSVAVTWRTRSASPAQSCRRSTSTTSAVWRSRARATRCRLAVGRERPGGRTNTTSTPLRSSPAASAQAARGRGTKTTRRRSIPSSATATTPGSSIPVTAHQRPPAVAADSRESPRLVPPWPGAATTTVVEPRRSAPSGKSGTRAAGSGRTRLWGVDTGRTLAASEAGTRRPSRILRALGASGTNICSHYTDGLSRMHPRHRCPPQSACVRRRHGGRYPGRKPVA